VWSDLVSSERQVKKTIGGMCENKNTTPWALAWLSSQTCVVIIVGHFNILSPNKDDHRMADRKIVRARLGSIGWVIRIY
jgi:hypothetical protein